MPEKPAKPEPRSVARSLLLTLPVALWSLLMFTPALRAGPNANRIASLLVACFMTVLFFLMMRTRQTYRWRRWFFAGLGFLFPIGFIWELIALRGSMSIPIERMLSEDTPFCFLAIPMMLIPAALTKTVIFPGSILPTASNPHSIAVMVGLWFAATLALGKAWCAYGCFFGGIEEGFAAFPKKARFTKLNPKWRLMPWAVLAVTVLASAALFEPFYCSWLCPFKTITEYAEVNSVETAVQTGVFLSLFLGLVVVGPVLTKKRTQCTFLCPFGVFQSWFNKIHIFDVRIQRDKCLDCVICSRDCPTMAIDAESVKKGRTLNDCMRCGACIDNCPKQAAVWHIKGTEPGAHPERARLLFLYAAWGFAIMFGGSILANSIQHIVGVL